MKVGSAQDAEPLSSAVGVLGSITGIKSSEDAAVCPLCFSLYGEKYLNMPMPGEGGRNALLNILNFNSFNIFLHSVYVFVSLVEHVRKKIIVMCTLIR